jgi:sugar phosphate isomerase/epimerase
LGNDLEAKRLEKFQQSLETLLPLAEENNLLLAVENMPPTSAGFLVSSIVSIVEKFDSPAVGICLDTGHLNITDEDMITAFDIAKEKIIAFHFHDNDGARDLHLQPPYGTINWPELVNEITKYDYDFPALVEAQPWDNASPQQLLREVEAIFRGEFLTSENDGRKAKSVCDKCRHYLFCEDGNVFCGCRK